MEKTPIVTNNAPKAIGAYSQGIKSGNMVFTSGQLPMNHETMELYKGDIKEAARLALTNLKEVLKAGGAELTDVVKVTVFVKDIAQFADINEVYATFFTEHKPARSLVQVAKLPLDADIEIEAVAMI